MEVAVQAPEVGCRPDQVAAPRRGLAEACQPVPVEECQLAQVVDYRQAPVAAFQLVREVGCPQALEGGFRPAREVACQLGQAVECRLGARLTTAICPLGQSL